MIFEARYLAEELKRVQCIQLKSKLINNLKFEKGNKQQLILLQSLVIIRICKLISII